MRTLRCVLCNTAAAFPRVKLCLFVILAGILLEYEHRDGTQGMKEIDLLQLTPECVFLSVSRALLASVLHARYVDALLSLRV